MLKLKPDVLHVSSGVLAVASWFRHFGLGVPEPVKWDFGLRHR